MRSIGFLKVTGLYVAAARTQYPKLGLAPVMVLKGSTVYEACDRAMASGVRPGMSSRSAHLACPAELESVGFSDIDPLPLSYPSFDICAEYSPIIEPVSADECFMELTGCSGTPDVIGGQILQSLSSHVCLMGRMGVASSKLKAKLACLSSLSTLTILQPPEEERFLSDLPIDHLWMVPGGAMTRLKQLGINTVGQLKSIPAGELSLQFGDLAITLSKVCSEEDLSRVLALYPPPSICCSHRFSDPVIDIGQLNLSLHALISEGASQLSLSTNVCKTAVLKVTFEAVTGHPKVLVRQFRFNSYTSSTYRLKSILSPWLESSATAPISELRLRLSDIRPETELQLSLYTLGASGTSSQTKSSSISSTLDSLNSRYGPKTVSLGLREDSDRRELLLEKLIPAARNYIHRSSTRS